jgi:hypothetical protein
VRKLRQKLRSVSPKWSYIHTHFGVGYRFQPQPDDELARAPADPPVVEPATPASELVDELDPSLGR